MTALRILIADDHEIVRRGLKQILLDEFAFAYIEEVTDGGALIEKAKTGDWSIILSDLSMPQVGGLQALKEIKKFAPKIPILILSMYPEEQYALTTIKAGAAGYLTKDMAQDELIHAVHKVLSGKKYFSPTMAEKLATYVQQERNVLLHETLSDRELMVLKMLAGGKTISEIAEMLTLGITTISTYRSRILEKMNMKTNADLTRYALEHQLI